MKFDRMNLQQGLWLAQRSNGFWGKRIRTSGTDKVVDTLEKVHAQLQRSGTQPITPE